MKEIVTIEIFSLVGLTNLNVLLNFFQTVAQARQINKKLKSFSKTFILSILYIWSSWQNLWL